MGKPGFKGVSHFAWCGCTQSLCPEGVCKAHKIWAAKVRRDEPAVIIVHLQSANIAKGVVVKDHSGQRYVVMDSCGELSNCEKSTTITRNGDYRHVAAGVSNTKGRCKSISQCSLIPGGYKSSRSAAGKRKSGHIPSLCQLINENTIHWKSVTNGAEPS